MGLLCFFAPQNFKNMIQRIQSLYLFISAIATGLVMFLPLYTAKFDVATLHVDYAKAELVSEGSTLESLEHLYVMIIVLLTVGLSLATIFLFKNRPTQMKLARLASLLNTALLVAILFLAVDGGKNMVNVKALANGGEVMGQYGVGAFLPIIGMILCFLAGIAIMKDEAMVRSANRLR